MDPDGRAGVEELRRREWGARNQDTVCEKVKQFQEEGNSCCWKDTHIGAHGVQFYFDCLYVLHVDLYCF